MRHFLIGLGGGAGLVAGTAALTAACGALAWHRATIHPLGLLVSLAGFVLVGAFQEAVFRGPLLSRPARRLPWLAALGLSLCFALVHPVPSLLAFTNTFLAGLGLSAAAFRTRSLWLPFGLHLGWNVAQRALGLAVSGVAAASGWTAHSSGPAWLSGGAYGPEGSAVATAWLVLSLLLALGLSPSARASLQAFDFFSVAQESR